MTSSTQTAFTMAVFMVALLVITTRTAEGQADCVSRLIPCADSLNSTSPPAPVCCNAIREVVSTQLSCLCNLLNNPNLLGGINITQALELPKRCNLSSDTSKCKEQAPSPTSSGVPPPRGVSGGNDGSGVGKSISSAGVPSLFLLLVIVMFH